MIRQKGTSHMFIPLATRMRPHTIDEVVGQRHILSPGSLLRRMIETDTMQSIILYGPPGTGKTTLARVIAETTSADFIRVNAVAAGKKDIESACVTAGKTLSNSHQRTILFIDEIHRFNKAQQDYLLPFVEDGTVVLIGATTENPFFEVNPALVSRSMIFELRPIEKEDLLALIDRTIADDVNGLGNENLTLTPEAREAIATQAGGDARHALSLLEMAALNADNSVITLECVENIIQKPHLHYDTNGDMHYDTICAFIESMRGSDPDAALYYLARMIHTGEDPKYICRRLVMAATEFVGNADPQALDVAVNAMLAVERIGMPEGRLLMAQAAIYIAMAPKCITTITSIDAALAYVAKHPDSSIPDPMRDCSYKSASRLGHGVGLPDVHATPFQWCPRQHLPLDVTEKFYHNSHVGYEADQAAYRNNIMNSYFAAEAAKQTK